MRKGFSRVGLAVVVPGIAFELPGVEPVFFRGAEGGFGVEHAVVGDDALEARGVAQDPVGHVAAVTGAEGALAGLVDEGVVLLGVVEAGHEVGDRACRPSRR